MEGVCRLDPRRLQRGGEDELGLWRKLGLGLWHGVLGEILGLWVLGLLLLLLLLPLLGKLLL